MAEMGEAVLALYRGFGRAAAPFMPFFLSRRARAGKEDPARLDERFGRASAPRPKGRVVWVHAASVGETNAVLPLICRLIDAGIAVVFTSVTVTSAGVAASRLPEGAIHQFAPLDIAPCIDRFLGHWQPELAIFVESELWPTTIGRLSNAGIPQVLVNARLSERSFKGWQRFSGVARPVFGRLTLCLAQTEADGARYKALGAPDVVVTGNLKLAAPPPAADPAAVADFRQAIGVRPVWVAASTHEGEETMIAEAHDKVASRYPDLLTIIVPRHPERGEAIAAGLKASGLTVTRRSAGAAPTGNIYLADTIGELGLFYRVAPVAFLGGSLVPHGGQNPIEAAQLGCAVLHGGHVHNFKDVYAVLDKSGGAEVIAGATSLATALDRLLTDPAEAARRASAAKDALKPFSGALDATLAALDPYIAGKTAA